MTAPSLIPRCPFQLFGCRGPAIRAPHERISHDCFCAAAADPQHRAAAVRWLEDQVLTAAERERAARLLAGS